MTQAPELPRLDRPLELPPRPLDAPRRRALSVDDLVSGTARRPSTGPPLTQRTTRYAGAWVRRHRISLIVLSSLLVVVGIVHGVGMSRMPLPVDDEGTYMAQAWAVQVRHALTPYTYWYDHPPVGWIQLAGWTFVTHAFSGATLAVVAGRRIMLLYSLADAALLYLIARRLRLSRVWASVAILAFALSPLAVNYQRMIYLDNLAMPWLLAAFALAMTPRRRLWTFGASGACFAVAVLSKETMLLFLPALVYQVWQRAHRTTRAFCVTAVVSVFGLLVAVYPLLALLKNELVPGPGHVSLSSAIAFQLNGRQGTGNPFNATSQAHSLVTGWLHLDPWLPVAGLVCLPVGLCVRRLRPVAVAELIALLDVLRGGYLPVPFIIGILPFAALLVAGTGSTLQGLVRWTAGRRAWAALKGGVLLGAAGALLVFVVPAWASGLRTQMATDQVTPTVEAESWVENHVPRTDRLLVDDTVWVDLVDHGFNRPYGVVWFYKLGSVNNLDPSVRRTLGGGWRNFQYVLETPSMRAALVGSGSRALPQVAQAVAHSVPVVSFGSGVDTIVVRRVTTSTGHGSTNVRRAAHSAGYHISQQLNESRKSQMTVEETPTPSPRFATVVRGYDRLQVDDYVEHLHRWIEQADYRAQQCEVAATRANSEADQLRRRLASVDAGTLTATPESMKALGDRVGSIMQSSFQAAKDLHRRAEDEARARAAAAEETATQIIAEATMRAEELSRAAEDLFVQAQEALARANSMASREMEEARARAATEGENLLERARNEARELARLTAEEERVREQLAVLEEHRKRVMEELGVLHKRLGDIGDGLSAPVPQQARQPRQAQAELKAAAPKRGNAGHDDETMVLELPAGGAGAKPTRRRVASSTR